MTAPTISLDHHHWVGLAGAAKGTRHDSVYRDLWDLGSRLRSQNLVRFPLSAERYYELLRTGAVHQRVDVAFAMAELSRYETLLQLTALTVQEIDRALAQWVPATEPRWDLPVIGQGVLHAFGRASLADGLKLHVPEDSTLPSEILRFLEAQMGAVASELLQSQFEWSVLSGDPRVMPLSPSVRANHDAVRRGFADEQTHNLGLVHQHQANAQDTGYLEAFKSCLDDLIRACDDHNIDMTVLPLETESRAILASIPTMHVLAELLGHLYRNPQRPFAEGDWADIRTLCQSVPYCNAVAPDRHFANALEATGLASNYGTTVLADKEELLDYLRTFDTPVADAP